MEINQKKIKLLIIFSSLILFIRISLITVSKPIIDPDSPQYIEHVTNLYNGYGFAIRDFTDNKIKATANKMPFFQYSTYVIMKILKLEINEIYKTIKYINLISSIITIMVLTLTSYIITNNIIVTFIIFIMLNLNMNIFYNSLLILTDTYHNFLLSLFIFVTILAFKKNYNFLYFLSGIILGLSTLTRPIMKYYFIFLLPIIITNKIKFKDKIIQTLLFLTAFILIISPWIIRNYKKMNFIGLETNYGINMLWSASLLIDSDKHSDKTISRIKRIIINNRNYSPWPAGAEIKAREELNLSEVQICKYFNTIAIETIFEKPLKFIKIFIRNIINNITSATSNLKFIDLIFYPGYYDIQHKIMIRFENIEKSPIKTIFLKDFLIIIPNLMFRALNFLFFIFTILGMFIFWKNTKEKVIVRFLVSIAIYVILISSLVSSYDRYRLPIEFIFIFFVAFYVTKRIIYKNN
ncbi:MAG: hypothetical protein N2Z20_04425 [Elusimicrobiales bacterium]|nr:hypothetical protein [Elusimicrobiales bacterium]